MGVFNDAVVRHLGGDPARHTAVGAGYGLERLAMIAIDRRHPQGGRRQRGLFHTRGRLLPEVQRH